MIRINKYLASCELGSRRKVEEIVLSGKVTINGVICKDLATMVNPTVDLVQVNNKAVQPTTQKIFIMINKPRGYVVTKSDEFKRKTVYDLLPDFAGVLHPVGRLDFDSEGLLIMTNDGNITNKITHPAYKIEKTYKVIVKGRILNESIQTLREGVNLQGEKQKTQPAKVFLKSASDIKSEIRICINEGKNRQIRRMMEAVGHEVVSLKRLQIGEIKLEKLPVGMWRFLSDKEILSLIRKKI
jgi:23S rRNA pseudouridine2605 synthase